MVSVAAKSKFPKKIAKKKTYGLPTGFGQTYTRDDGDGKDKEGASKKLKEDEKMKDHKMKSFKKKTQRGKSIGQLGKAHYRS